MAKRRLKLKTRATTNSALDLEAAVNLDPHIPYCCQNLLLANPEQFMRSKVAKKKKIEFGPRDNDGELDSDWKKWAWRIPRKYWDQFKPRIELFEFRSYDPKHRAIVETLWTPPKVMSLYALHDEKMECLLGTNENGSLSVKGRFVSGPSFIKYQEMFHALAEPQDWPRILQFYHVFIEEKKAAKIERAERRRPGVYRADMRASLEK